MTFTIPDEDIPAINEFMQEQDKKTGGHYGAIGGGYTYHFTPTALAVVIKVENTVTKAVLDLSHYELW